MLLNNLDLTANDQTDFLKNFTLKSNQLDQTISNESDSDTSSYHSAISIHENHTSHQALLPATNLKSETELQTDQKQVEIDSELQLQIQVGCQLQEKIDKQVIVMKAQHHFIQNLQRANLHLKTKLKKLQENTCEQQPPELDVCQKRDEVSDELEMMPLGSIEQLNKAEKLRDKENRYQQRQDSSQRLTHEEPQVDVRKSLGYNTQSYQENRYRKGQPFTGGNSQYSQDGMRNELLKTNFKVSVHKEFKEHRHRQPFPQTEFGNKDFSNFYANSDIQRPAEQQNKPRGCGRGIRQNNNLANGQNKFSAGHPLEFHSTGQNQQRREKGHFGSFKQDERLNGARGRGNRQVNEVTHQNQYRNQDLPVSSNGGNNWGMKSHQKFKKDLFKNDFRKSNGQLKDFNQVSNSRGRGKMIVKDIHDRVTFTQIDVGEFIISQKEQKFAPIHYFVDEDEELERCQNQNLNLQTLDQSADEEPQVQEIGEKASERVQPVEEQMVYEFEEENNQYSEGELDLSCEEKSEEQLNGLRGEIVNAIESCNEVVLNAKIEEARSLGRRYEWQEELEQAESVLYDIACVGQELELQQ